MDLKILASLGVYGIIPLSLFIASLLLVIKELGFRAGKSRNRTSSEESAGIVVGSILAITAFVLALTLNAATTRLTDRRMSTLAEANAIGTARLQAETLHQQGESLVSLIDAYAKARLRYVAAGNRIDEIDQATRDTDALQLSIWAEVKRILDARDGPIAASVMNATNTMFDATAAARFAIENGLPVSMVRLLFALALGGMFSLGWQLGQTGRPNYLLAGVLALCWGAVVVHILDMGTARFGKFGIDQSPYLWTLGSMTSEMK